MPLNVYVLNFTIGLKRYVLWIGASANYVSDNGLLRKAVFKW